VGPRRRSEIAEVPAFTQAIEAHQRRITEAILEHALKICSDKNVSGGGIEESYLYRLVLVCSSGCLFLNR
jgi:hypothetical protein